MKYYCSTIPHTLAEKLKEKGMPIDLVQHDVQGMIYADYAVTYASTFYWLMERGFAVTIYGCGSGYHWLLDKECDNPTRGTHITQSMCGDGPNDGGCWDTWHEAANAAIEKALTLI